MNNFLHYRPSPKMDPDVALANRHRTRAVAKYIDGVRNGRLHLIKHLRWGQQGPYGDTLYEAELLVVELGACMDNSPALIQVSRTEAARQFQREMSWAERPHFLAARLVKLIPIKAPDGTPPLGDKSAAWYILVKKPYND